MQISPRALENSSVPEHSSGPVGITFMDWSSYTFNFNRTSAKRHWKKPLLCFVGKLLVLESQDTTDVLLCISNILSKKNRYRALPNLTKEEFFSLLSLMLGNWFKFCNLSSNNETFPGKLYVLDRVKCSW